jgi:AhpD family alkylhydroperoxidase
MAARIPPGTTREIGRANMLFARLAGLATGGPPPNVFTTLARNRRLFRRWLWFAGGLMPGGRLPRRDTELLILRVAHASGCDYEWNHHEQLGRRAGLGAAEIAAAREGPGASALTPRQALLLRAADELLEAGEIGDPLWAELAAELDDRLLIELCLLVGHYAMLAMTLNSLRVEPDEASAGGRPPRAARALRALAERRGR